jgi:hypothetical protein
MRKRGSELRDLREYAAMTLEETIAASGHVVSVAKLSRCERGLEGISDEHREKLERTLRNEISLRSARLAKTIASWPVARAGVRA